MKHLGLLAGSFLISGTLSAQNLPSSATSLKGFVPAGWRVISQQSGDLNKDSVTDLAFVLESTESYTISEREYNRRMLGIAFGKKSGGYQLVEQSNKFIINGDEDQSLDEPFVEMKIKNGTLHFEFRFWYSMGTYSVNNDTYIFRYQNNRFELIGYGSDDFSRSTHEERKLSVNYSTKIYHIMEVDANEKVKSRVKKNFKYGKLLTINQINPYEFSAF